MERVGASQRLRANAAGGGATPGAPAPSAPSAMGRRPLPRGLARVVWRQAADIVARLLRADGARRGGASVKSLTLRDGIAAKKATHAVVCECLKHVPLLREVLDDARVPLTEDAEEDGDEEEEEEEEEEERRRARGGGADATSSRDADADDERTRRRGVPRSAAYVLTYELLFGAGLPDDAEEEEEEATRRRRPPDVVADVVAARATLIAGYRDALTRSLRTRLRRAKASSVEAYLRALPGGDLVASVPTHSRHARVNVLKISVADAMKRLSRLSPALGAFEYHAGPHPHVPNLVVAPPGTDLHAHAMVKRGELILQGKSSCFPAVALGARAGWHVVDACAAPGNKTTHVAAVVGAGGRVFAFDADRARLRRLKANVASAGAGEIVVARCEDFLSVDVNDPEYAEVRAVLLDPSCSGSGTSGTRGDYLLAAARGDVVGGSGADVAGGSGADVAPPDARVAALAAFQTKALLHALSFPSAERVSYSTCSVHALENERVVKTVAPRALEMGYTLEKALPTWYRRGLESESAGLEAIGGAECLVRADQREDDCEGFFVAVFARPPPPGAAERTAAAKAKREAEAEAAREKREARAAKKRARSDGSEGVVAVGGSGGGGGGKKKKKKKGAKSKPGRLFK